MTFDEALKEWDRLARADDLGGETEYRLFVEWPELAKVKNRPDPTDRTYWDDEVIARWNKPSNPVVDWPRLGTGYPNDGTSRLEVIARSLFDVLAPVMPELTGERSPVYELGHEETPTPEEVWELAKNCALAALQALGYDETACPECKMAPQPDRIPLPRGWHRALKSERQSFAPGLCPECGNHLGKKTHG